MPPMNEHNEFDVKPGVYTYKEIHFVVLDVITHHNQQPLPEPNVVYRSVMAPIVNGRAIHERYTVPLSYFKENFNAE